MIKNIKYILFPLTTAFLFFVFYAVIGLYPEVLWFESFKYDHVWWFIFRSKFFAFALFFLIAFCWLSVNIWLARKLSKSDKSKNDIPEFKTEGMLEQIVKQLINNFFGQSKTVVNARSYKLIISVGVAIISLMMGLTAKAWWQDFYMFFNKTSFNLADPIYNLDISFYIFSMPFLSHIQGWFFTLCLFSLVLSFGVYFSKGIFPEQLIKGLKNIRIKTHLFALIAILALSISCKFWFSLVGLLYSSRGIVFGAGYTDVYAQSIAYKAMILLWLIEAGIIFVIGFRRGFKVPVYFLGVIIITAVILGKVYPGIIQNYVVAPNEIQKETKFIKNNIKYTRIAYGLDNIEEEEYAVSNNLTYQDIVNRPAVMSNVRLWNQGPLKQTFRQLQEIRLYYEFVNVDVDRYTIDGNLRQVMLAPRELDITQLAPRAQTWTNKHLVYTHGYGLCVSPVNQVTPEGLPYFYLKNLPPESNVGLDVSNPEIYFGEKTSHYIIVNSKELEFNYPRGDSNEYTRYMGKGGILLDSFAKRFVYALKFSDLKILINTRLTSDSKLLYNRNVKDVAKAIAPFLVFDDDAYMVISASGRLVWMLDAYTFSNKFPYSEPFQGLNYLRNSVKITMDAYDGTINFYIVDRNEPMIATYAKVYKGIFKDFEDMPSDLKAHIRYPKGLFNVQANMYRTYHMTDPRVFYSREDLWSVPSEKYEDSEKLMQPYYMVTQLPGDKEESFIIMLPFTPTKKNNMISWLAAKCDPNEYGKLKVFKFPKKSTIYGPMQIESRVDQDTEISQKLTLWGQMGSKVIRGNLMVIPIADTLIYVEPIYLQATQSKLPELKRVIFAYKDSVVMADNLDNAINKVFPDNGETRNMPNSSGLFDKVVNKSAETMDTVIEKLIKEYSEFKGFAKNNKWKSFGESLDSIDSLIKKLLQFQTEKK